MPDRNVLFITFDQLRADVLFGALGAQVPLPNLDRLRANAVTFRRHYSVANPCGPSRASMLTGQYAMNHRSVRNGTPLRHDTPNLATELRKGGYRPMLFGYTDCSQDPRVFAPGDPALTTYEQVMPGFEEVVEMRLEESWPWRAHLKAKGYAVPDGDAIYRPEGSRVNDPALYRAEDSDTAFLTDCAIRDLTARPAGWMAHLTYIRPHSPFVAPAPWNRLCAPDAMPAAQARGDLAAEQAVHPYMAAHLHGRALAGMVEGFADLEPTPGTVAAVRAVYLGLVAEVDHHLGRLFDALQAAGQWDDTLVVVTSDHGEMLGDRHDWGKMSVFDAAWHVPLILRDPDNPAQFGTEVDAMTESVDIAPTILHWAGRDVPDSMDGASLMPFVRGERPETWRRHTYSELDFGDPVSPTRAQAALGLDADLCNLAILRTRRHSLVQFAADLPPLLFDRDGDGEDRDIAGEPDAAAALLELTRAMLRHRMANPDGLFARTMITPAGPVRG